MYNSKELQTFNLAEKTAKVKLLTAQTAENIIEIGKTLIEVKENLPYGKFEKWLETDINYSKRTAYNFIKVAKEFPDVQPVAQLGIRKLLALTGLETDDREKVINDNDLESMTAKEVEEVIKIEKQLESIQFLMEILSNEVTQTGFDYDSIPNIDWNIDMFTNEKLTLEEVKELQKGVEELFVEDINITRIYWYKHIDTLRKNSTDDKDFVQKFYEEDIMGKIKGDIDGDEYSRCSYIYWNIMLIEYCESKGAEQ